MRNILPISCLLLCPTSPALADGDYDRGKELAKSWECTNCHGLTGNERWPETPGLAGVPMLAGQPISFLVKSLKEFKSGDRIDDSEQSKMTVTTQALSDQDIEDIAKYYSAQKRY